MSTSNITISLVGNPNVGKSSIFNQLTGLNQHTGNWPGKTVVTARGRYVFENREYALVDTPGAYSLTAHSPEEEATSEFVRSGEASVIVVICDATCLERNLNLVLQILEVTQRVVICVNLMDEARKKKISIDLEKLERELGVPVIGAEALTGAGMRKLMRAIASESQKADGLPEIKESSVFERVKKAESICAACVHYGKADYNALDRRIDRLLTSRWSGPLIMLTLLALVFWLTIIGANYPSAALSKFFFWIEGGMLAFLENIQAPGWVSGLFITGIYRVLSWVVAVMLPPMAIFFPLFTFLEDLGYLPRVAFNMDYYFKKCRACGKQALTMCMGFGCNAAAVIGCRIIDSPRERLIAVLTNSFVPCNGRFPAIIALIAMFFAVPTVRTASAASNSILSALLLTAVILSGILLTLFMSRILSRTILQGVPSSFTLELPPFRKPRLSKIIVRSLLDRTLFVLARAVIVSVPAGAIVWLMNNITVGGLSLLQLSTQTLDPFARFIGLDGTILMAFILGFPANEIVIPIIIMAYASANGITSYESLAQLKVLFIDHGWTWLTALCMIIFSLSHWPCSTTCLTIYKETRSVKWTALACAVPTFSGLLICFVLTAAVRLLGGA
ncbi:MAG: ferrous iron transporter B [Clostridiales bacterium]|nr:ferrous iron transporter B [Clostridiales bacterium]